MYFYQFRKKHQVPQIEAAQLLIFLVQPTYTQVSMSITLVSYQISAYLLLNLIISH